MKKIIFIIIFSFLFSSPVKFNINTDRADVLKGEYIKLLIDINSGIVEMKNNTIIILAE